MEKIICKMFGHNKRYWKVGLGSDYAFCWCKRCGLDFKIKQL